MKLEPVPVSRTTENRFVVRNVRPILVDIRYFSLYNTKTVLFVRKRVIFRYGRWRQSKLFARYGIFDATEVYERKCDFLKVFLGY